MYYGDLVTVLPDKIRLSEKELAPIGILDQSVCWSRWVPDRWRNAAEQRSPPHLVVSPFDISSWPVLFRLTAFIEDGRPGSLASLLQVLEKNSFNILAIEGTPAGHNHAVVNIIGEATDIKHDGTTLEQGRLLSDKDRSFSNSALSRYVHETFSPRLLSYSKSLTEALIRENDANPFLRHSFVFGGTSTRPRGSLFDPDKLPPDIAPLGKRQSNEAVKCIWLKNHAFFWLYGAGDMLDRTFTYDARHWALRPAPIWKREFSSTVKSLHPPFKAVSSINYEEQYLRVAFSPLDRRSNTFRIKMPYAAAFPVGKTTKGMLSTICTQFTKSNITLRSVSVSTEYRDQTAERGTYVFLASIQRPPKFSLSEQEVLNVVRTVAQTSCTNAAETLKLDQCDAEFATPIVSPFAARMLFLSTRFDWVKDVRPGLIKRITSTAADYGFRLVVADHDYLEEEHRFLWDGSAPITSNIIRLMRASDCFLQIVPKSAIESSIKLGSLNWVLFESGAAHALHLPCAICVDTSGGQRLGNWINKLKAGTEKRIFEFSSETDDDQISRDIEIALDFLSKEDRPPRMSRFESARDPGF